MNIFGYRNVGGSKATSTLLFRINGKQSNGSMKHCCLWSDPGQFTLWCQSSRASAKNMQLFAWLYDSMIRASISSSRVIVRAMNYLIVILFSESLSYPLTKVIIGTRRQPHPTMPTRGGFLGLQPVIGSTVAHYSRWKSSSESEAKHASNGSNYSHRTKVPRE